MSMTIAAEAKPVWIQQRNFKCVNLTPKAEDGVDHVLYKCATKDLPTLWVHFMDSSRSFIGFGSRPNFASSVGNINQSFGPIEWGGEVVSGKFNPLVGIARVYFDDFNFDPAKLDNNLEVFRFLADGTSCLIGSIGHVSNQNKKARDMATSAFKTWVCLTEPELIDVMR